MKKQKQRYSKLRNNRGSVLKSMLFSLIALAMIAISLFYLSRNSQYQLFGELVYRVETDQKVVALTFDDGPTPKGSDAILDLLAKENIKSTFFLNGSWIKRYPELTKKIMEQGHELANHSYSHHRMVFMSPSRVKKEVDDTTNEIQKLGYKGEIRFRPPFGKRLVTLPRYLSKIGMTTVTWDVAPETFEPELDTPDQITKRALDGVKPGSIVVLHVMHDGPPTLEALPNIISGLKRRGYKFATVDTLLKLNTEKQ